MIEYTIDLLQQWAFTDDLTGISNRRHLGLVEDERKALDDTTFYVAIDLNGFKAAQDRPGRGHAWGDRVLRRFARALLSCTRQMDVRGSSRRKLEPGRSDIVLGRQGGDEFLVIAPTERGAQAIAGRVRAWGYAGVTASAGVGLTRKTADAALYREKARRRAG